MILALRRIQYLNSNNSDVRRKVIDSICHPSKCKETENRMLNVELSEVRILSSNYAPIAPIAHFVDLSGSSLSRFSQWLSFWLETC
jgi:hypothetical protein